jgi:RecB family exonuclease
MAVRARDPEIAKIKQSGGKIYSISKCNTIDNCLYEAYMQYISDIPPDDSVYGVLGSGVHDTLEKIMNGKADESELAMSLAQDLQKAEQKGLNFPKDKNGGDSIREKWVADMTDFCEKFRRLPGEFETERLVLYPLDDKHYVQGYIDLVKHNEDGTVDIYDWKTSSNFSAADLKHHGRQLAIYKTAMEHMGYTVNRTAWIMLKYIAVTDTVTGRIYPASRSQTVKDMQKPLISILKKQGMDDETAVLKVSTYGSLDDINREFGNRFTTDLYIRDYTVTEETEKECLNYINNKIKVWEHHEKENWKDIAPRDFIAVSGKGNIREDTFYCNNLCGYRKKCKYIENFNHSRDEDDGLF